jgi:phytoene dehydrogenase-like protein
MLVREILVEPSRTRAGRHNRAVGVRLADGSERCADVVISAADGHSTLFEMLGPTPVGRQERARFETWPTFPAIAVTSYGVRRAYPDWPASNLVRLQRPLVLAGQEVTHLSCRVFHGPAFAPPGQSVVQVLFATPFDHWNDLQHDDRARYEADKRGLAALVLERLEAHLPGIAAAVEMTDVATPYTFWRNTRNWRGAFGGWLITPERLGHPLPKTLPGLDRFYMAGRWVEPGGGVPLSLRSGRQAIQLLCHHDKVPFAATPA